MGRARLLRSLGPQRLDTGRPGTRYTTNDQVSQVGRGFSSAWNPKSRLAIPKLGLKVSAGNSGRAQEAGPPRRVPAELPLRVRRPDQDGFNKTLHLPSRRKRGHAPRGLRLQEGRPGSALGHVRERLPRAQPGQLPQPDDHVQSHERGRNHAPAGRSQNDDVFLLSKNSYNFIGRRSVFNQLTGDHRNLARQQGEASLERRRQHGSARRARPAQVQQQVESQTSRRPLASSPTSSRSPSAAQTSVRFPLYRSVRLHRVRHDRHGRRATTERDFTARRFTSSGLRRRRASRRRPRSRLRSRWPGTDQHDRRSHAPTTATRQATPGSEATLQLETPMADWLKFLGLLRMEVFRQQVETKSPSSNDPADPAAARLERPTDRTDLDPMPSANFSLSRSIDEMFVKLGYGMTVIRPAIRELAPYRIPRFPSRLARCRQSGPSAHPRSECRGSIRVLLRRHEPVRGHRCSTSTSSTRSSS